MIYLDYNATTPLSSEAQAAMLPYLGQHFGNASSIHQAGRMARAAVDLARDRIAALLQAKPGELIFTGGGTEADNLAVIGLARAQSTKGKHLITSQTEHHAVLHAFDFLEKKEGYRVTRLAVNRTGQIDLGELNDSLVDDTTLVSLMSANNETGAKQLVGEASELCRAKGVLFHSDIVQSFGKEPVNTALFDAVTIAAHKFCGPKGVGVLRLAPGLPIERLQYGGSHEGERRAGTENVAAIAGMAAAAEEAIRSMHEEQVRLEEIRSFFWAGISRAYPAAALNGHPTDRLSNTLNISFPAFEAETLLMNLDLAGICASSGSACMAGSVQLSHVLVAMGLPLDHSRGTVRFSMGKYTTRDEIVDATSRIAAIFSRLQPTAHAT